MTYGFFLVFVLADFKLEIIGRQGPLRCRISRKRSWCRRLQRCKRTCPRRRCRPAGRCWQAGSGLRAKDWPGSRRRISRTHWSFRHPIIQVGRALKDRRRRVRHIENVEAFASRSADSDVGVVAMDVDRRLVERREIALTYAYRNCRVRYVEYLEAIGVTAALDDVGVLATDE